MCSQLSRYLTLSFNYFLQPLVAVLITGGHNTGVGGSVELFVPGSGDACRLPQLPGNREFHSLDTNLLCGGMNTEESCLRWIPAHGPIQQSFWSVSHHLEVTRAFHVSWTPDTDIGTYLMGGNDAASQASTTLLKPDGSQELGFPLKYDTRFNMSMHNIL